MGNHGSQNTTNANEIQRSLMMKIKNLSYALLIIVLQTPLALTASEQRGPLTLDQCIALALKQNQQRRITQLGVETAEAQLQQALSAYWPQVSFETAYTQMDEDINFIFPRETSQYTISDITQVPMTATVTIPKKNVKVMERDNIVTRLKMMYPLYSGGLRKAMIRRADAGVASAKQVNRRTELQLIYDVKRMYYGAVLARRLYDIGEQALLRLQATVELTETLYKSGSKIVNKRDYLRSKVIFESAHTIVTLMRSNVELAQTALANTMGLKWDHTIDLAENQIPYIPIQVELDHMVAGAYSFNPDWKQLEAAVDAYDAEVSKEKSRRWPNVGLTGTLWRWDNDLDNSGMATDDNEQGWSVGVGMNLPLFSGFLTTGKIRTARAQLKAIKARQLLFKGGLALKIKHAFLRMDHARRIRKSTQAAAETATQNRNLTERAYRMELAGVDDVIESQVMESLTKIRAEESLYNYTSAQYLLSFLVGTEVGRMIK
jgi:outer membrane protein TolC